LFDDLDYLFVGQEVGYLLLVVKLKLGEEVEYVIVLLFGCLTVYDLFFFEKARGLDFTVEGIEDFF
jgi:hypothetical protein